jgi:hypothetical protein
VIERPRIGDTYLYRSHRGAEALVRVKGYRGLSWIETDGVIDGRHRSISRKQLYPVPA